MTRIALADDQKQRKQRFGARLSIAREAAELTLEELGNRLGITPQAVHEWETGRAEPSVSRIGLVAAILNCDLAWLITGQGDQTGRGEEGAEVTDDQNSERKLAANAAYGALLMPSRETPELEPIARRLGRALGLEDNSDLVSDGQRNRIRELRTSKNTCEG